MIGRMDDTAAEVLARQAGLEPGRVTWLVGRPGIGLSSVARAAVRAATAQDKDVFVADPEGAFRLGNDGGFSLYSGGSLDESLRLAHAAAEAGAGLVVLDAISLAIPATTWAGREQALYYASGGLRGIACGPSGSRTAVLATVHEPLNGFDRPAPGHTSVSRAFAFPMGEGFEGDRVVRMTPEGTLETWRP